MPASMQDESMADVPANVEEDTPEQQLLGLGDMSARDRIHVLPGSTEKAASFQFDGEDHTLGNALRYIIGKNPEVEFCGYSIPHPTEDRMNLRIQIYDDADPSTTVYTVLEKGLSDMVDLCDVVTEKFTHARDQFNVS